MTREAGSLPPMSGDYVPPGASWEREATEAQQRERAARRVSAETADAADAAVLAAAYPGARVQHRDRIWSAVAPDGTPLVSTGPAGLGWQLAQAHHRPHDAETEARALADLRAFFLRWTVTVCDDLWEAIPAEHGGDGYRLTASSPGELALLMIRAEMQMHVRRVMTST